MTFRPYFSPRMGCLGWVVFGGLMLAFYAVVIAGAMALCLVAAIGLGIDWTLRQTVKSYRDRRAGIPLEWPRALARTAASAFLVRR